ncbi:pyridoxamine 5'-phosphate oxidase family protein [Microcoleus sp. CAWBG640]|uniref:pyridoxamine 5'-phosphate oxidase family protein n=1 Tax=Microcoleus sp. CAWBG640 TaxID=2841653 RepID=UPI00312B83BA
MLDIDEMSSKEIEQLLHTVGYGHLGCIHEGKPYVMPMNYYIEEQEIYLFTTIGMKTHDIDANPEVCLQVEEIQDALHWRSAIVNGRASRLTIKEEIDRAMHFIQERNPTLSPGMARTWIDAEGRSEAIAIYRIHETEMSGRTTDGVSSH